MMTEQELKGLVTVASLAFRELALSMAKATLPIHYNCWLRDWNRRTKKAYHGDFPRFLHYHADHARRCKRRYKEKLTEYQ